MKKMLFMGILPLLLMAQPSKEIQQSLATWQPISMTIKSGNLLIVTKENRVTDTIFKAIIKNGVCMPIWLGSKKALNGIKEITILNKFQKQGYIFEGGKNACQEMGNLKDKQSDFYLLGHSRLY